MSADNGIYIGIFPLRGDSNSSESKSKYEYRVIHAQAIENCDLSPDSLADLYIAVYYGSPNAKVFSSEEEAERYALKWQDDFDLLEYGVSMIEYPRPMPDILYEEADKKLYATR